MQTSNLGNGGVCGDAVDGVTLSQLLSRIEALSKDNQRMERQMEDLKVTLDGEISNLKREVRSLQQSLNKKESTSSSGVVAPVLSHTTPTAALPSFAYIPRVQPAVPHHHYSEQYKFEGKKKRKSKKAHESLKKMLMKLEDRPKKKIKTGKGTKKFHSRKV